MPSYIRLVVDELGDPFIVLENAANSDEGVYNGVLQATVGNDYRNSEYEFEVEVFAE